MVTIRQILVREHGEHDSFIEEIVSSSVLRLLNELVLMTLLFEKLIRLL